MAERLARALWRSVCREAALWRSFCWPGRREVRKGRRGAALGTLRVGDPALGRVGRCRIAKAARREPYAWELVLGNLRWGTLRGNPCWVTSVWDPALGNKGVLGASGLYLNQLRGFCFVVPCQSSK